jgi:2-oxoglutarate ferredoxin oxidoreductase subunit delta
MASRKLKGHLINRSWCKGCGICVHFCPKGVFRLDEREKVCVAHPEDCVACSLCALLCPDLCIEVAINEEEGSAA